VYHLGTFEAAIKKGYGGGIWGWKCAHGSSYTGLLCHQLPGAMSGTCAKYGTCLKCNLKEDEIDGRRSGR
jgi:hypothetical protein